jgi:hypothetical protein
MGKQYNKVIKLARRKAAMKRKKQRLKIELSGKRKAVKAAAPAKA